MFQIFAYVIGILLVLLGIRWFVAKRDEDRPLPPKEVTTTVWPGEDDAYGGLGDPKPLPAPEAWPAARPPAARPTKLFKDSDVVLVTKPKRKRNTPAHVAPRRSR
jgi:hypothetical protein